MERLVFQSFDEYAAAVQHADLRVTLASRQQANWSIDYLPLGDMSIQWGQEGGPNVVEGSSSPGGLTLFIPRYNANAIIGNGHRMDTGSVMVLEPGAEFCIAATGVNRWSSIFVPYDQLVALDEPGSEINRKHSVLLPTAAGKKLQRLVEHLGSASRNVPHALWLTPAATTATRKITEIVNETLGFQNEVTASLGRHTLSRDQITRAALQILEEHSDEHVSVSRLSSMIGVSERTLRTAFEEYFGIGPTRYLKLRTLHQARKLLKTSDPYKKSVTEIAVGLGIWELGRFSHDYQMLFDELPSKTLQNRDSSMRKSSSFTIRPASVGKSSGSTVKPVVSELAITGQCTH